MRLHRLLPFTMAALALFWAGSVLATTSAMSYQGRLTNTSGTPVADGPYSVTFTIWTDSVGGSMVWSESQTVHVTGGGGLFSCYLGNIQPLGGPIVIHGNDNLYIQSAVAGQTLLPRLPIGAVPRAISAAAVQQSIPGVGSVEIAVGDDTTKMTTSHQGFADLIDSYLNLTDDSGLLGLKCYGAGQPHRQSCNSEVTDEEARHSLDYDADGDGIADGTIWGKVDNTEALSMVGVDVNDDGVPDVGSSSSSKASRNVLKSFFLRGDRPTESQFIDSLDETGAYEGTIRWHGTDFEGHRVSLMPESALVSTEVSNPDVSSSSNIRIRINALENSLKCLGLLARSSVTQSLTPTTCGVAINTKGTGAAKGRTISTACDDSTAVQTLDVDDDGDGHAEARGIIAVKSSTGSGSASASSRMTADSDDDGIPESEISQIVTPTTCGVAINTKGTGAAKGRTISTACDDSSAVQTLDVDDDGDGHAEARGIISVKSPSGSGSASASSRMTADSDDDGIPDVVVSESASPAGAQRFTFHSKPVIADFLVMETNEVCDDASASYLLKAAHSGSTTGTVLMTATPEGASTFIDHDADNDGVAEFSSGGTVNDSSSQWSVSSGADVPGNHKDGWNVLASAKSTREELKAQFQNGDIPSQDQVVDSTGSTFKAINTTGTGATVRVAMAATDGATTVCDVDSDGDGQSDAQANIAALLNGSVVIGCMRDSDDDGVADVSSETTVNDDSATFRLNSMPPGLPAASSIAMAATSTGVHMEVGAATCDGTNWTNASDKNLKENFRDVDGEALLHKISNLAITRWNYKGDTRHEHIGPTAQDFKASFGVGSDGKSISTIDPSGIALAAIKELNKQNRELKQENETLKQRLDALAVQVERLAASR